MMRAPLTFSLYVGRHFLASIGLALGVVLAVIELIDLVEMLRRTSGKEGVPMSAVTQMVLLKLPYMMETFLPYGVLIGGMLALTRLTRSQELVVARASGISVWQFLFPLLALGLMIGALSIAVLNPIAAAMVARYEQLEGRYISGRPSLLTISESGLWLRQRESAAAVINGKTVEEYILRAQRISQADMSFSNVTVFTFSPDDGFIARIDAEQARLGNGYWEFTDATLSAPGLMPEGQALYHLPTKLEISEIRDSFAEPRTLSFWQLSRFIHTLEEAGFDALRHKVHWHATLALPVLLLGMVLLAAVFSLRLPRKGRGGLMVLGALVAGFVLFFLINLFHAFGYSGSLPVALAAWAPPAILIMSALAALLHLEDG